MRKPRALAATVAVAALGMAGCGTVHVVSGPPLAGNPALRLPAASPRPSADLYRSRPGATAGIALPKVSLGSQQDMNGLLTRLGMGIAFGARADFTGLSPRACCISLVEQAATLQVGEKGTAGSAATAVGLMPADAEAPIGRQIVFNRPYLMLVTDTATGEPLFLARVADPGG